MLMRVYQFEILNNERIITSTQVALKNFLALFHENTEDNHPTHNSPGAVPIANAIIISAQSMKLPVVIAYACIASVKPQGKKNVIAQVVIANLCFDHPLSFQTFFHSDLGNVRVSPLIFGEISDKFIPKNNITIQVTRVITQIAKGDSENTCQNRPSIPHKKANHSILQILKNI